MIGHEEVRMAVISMYDRTRAMVLEKAGASDNSLLKDDSFTHL